MELRVIDNFDDFQKLEQPWNELLSQTEVDHAYMKHQWFECWISNLGRFDNLVIPTAWLDGQLVGIAPMQITIDKIKGLPVKVLCFLSSGISPRCNFIAHESLEKKVFFDYIFGYKGWDLMIANNIESELNITKSYIKYLKFSKKKYKIEQGFNSPYLNIESSWDDYWRSLSKSFKKDLQNSTNRLNKSNSFKVYCVTNYKIFSEVFDRILETSAKSWKGNINSDLKSEKKLQSFYDDFSRKGSDMGLFELWILEIDDHIASFAYRLKSRNVLTGIRTDFDPEYKYYNPGKMLQLFILKDLFNREGVWQYDLGGMAGSHKTNWANNIKRHYIVTTGSSSFYGNLLMIGKLKVLPLAQKLFSSRIHE
jgi:hypothetical protein